MMKIIFMIQRSLHVTYVREGVKKTNSEGREILTTPYKSQLGDKVENKNTSQDPPEFGEQSIEWEQSGFWV